MRNTEKKIVDNMDAILKMIEANRPKSEICKFLHMKQETLNFYLKKYNIVYAGNMNRAGIPRYNERAPYTKYTEEGAHITSSGLRKKLIEQGVKEAKCECCGLTQWMGKPIPLELHHIDSNRFNNSLENLIILCSNCHSQEHSYSNISVKEKPPKEKIIKEKLFKEKRKVVKPKDVCSCGEEKLITSKQCLSCAKKGLRRTERPPLEQLLQQVEELGYSATGRIYGVSDNAIRKWIK